jgi:S-adenosylmethionine:tRNA ribosyltransferase-isomerase
MARHLNIADFTYELPQERIAIRPAETRDASKLLLYRDGTIHDHVFYQLHEHLPADALLVVNDTRVVPARIIFPNLDGTNVELFYLEPALPIEPAATMAQSRSLSIKAYVGRARKWKPDTALVRHFPESGIALEAHMIGKTNDHFTIRLSWNPPEYTFAEILHLAGQIPLPPYLNRPADQRDQERYQTVYARHEGSVAAPTAGLHFTDGVFKSLTDKGIQTEHVTLHVGAGTFKPVQVEQMADHPMHGELLDVSYPTLLRLIAQQGRPIVPVGTTAMRTLESLYWIGCQIIGKKISTLKGLRVEQFEPYDYPSDISVPHALEAVADAMQRAGAHRLLAQTHLMIAPGYRFRMADALITNFHQPRSTLLLLVAAFTEGNWTAIYRHALDNGYRFLSYGDSSLLWKKP